MNDILDSDIVVVEIPEDEIIVIDLGPAGMLPPVADFNTVSLLTQAITSESGVLSINRSLGEYVKATVNEDITDVVITEWPPLPYLGRIVLEIISTGNYIVTWPAWIKWARNSAPDISASGNDVFLLTTTDEGATVKGSVIGQDYPQ